MFAKVKEFLFGTNSNDTDSIEHMPSDQREHLKPKFILRKEVNNRGQIYIPKAVRVSSLGSNIDAGDSISIDIFTDGFSHSALPSEKSNSREKYVDVTVTNNYMITIPKEVRDELNISGGDTIAIHAYITFDTE
jgi:AbrB family looped-hinge helix DNA binding protein